MQVSIRACSFNGKTFLSKRKVPSSSLGGPASMSISQKGSVIDLTETIIESAKSKTKFVIALSGFGGSGKSSLAKKLSDTLQNAVIISLDDFIINRLDERSSNWSGFDWNRLTKEILKPIQDGEQKVTYGVYNWKQNKIIENKTLPLPKYIIVEGCGLIRDELNPYFDFSIWIDLPLEIASDRGSTRDREEYKVDHDKLWSEKWTPNDKDYFEKYQPEKHANFLLSA